MARPTAGPYMRFIQPIKGRFVMSRILNRTTGIIMLGLVTMGAAHAHAANHNPYGPGGQIQAQAQPQYTMRYDGGIKSPTWTAVGSGRSVAGLACDLPSSTCSNDERIND
jgi:hypothetical protein